MIGMLLVVGVIGLITFTLYKSTTKRARYFEERKLKYIGPLSGFGSLFALLFRKFDIIELTKQMYNRFPNEP